MRRRLSARWMPDEALFRPDVAQAVLQGADFAEPLAFACLGYAASGAGLDLVQAGCLGRVEPEERAFDACSWTQGVP